VTIRSTSLMFQMPISHLETIKNIPGVQDVTYASWFGGIYKDPKNFFGQFAVDPEGYLRMYPEIQLTPDERKAVPRRSHGLHHRRRAGQDLRASRSATRSRCRSAFRSTASAITTSPVRAIYRSGGAAVDNQSMMFHWKYADERSMLKGQIGWYVTQIANPDQAPQIMRAIDEKFANSPYETKTDTERAFQTSFVSMFGNLNLLLGSIALAVVITTLFVAANTMAMSVRERTTEIAVMRTLGFPSATIFLLVAGEGLLMATVGGILGIAAARTIVNPRFLNAWRIHSCNRRQQRQRPGGPRAERGHWPAGGADSGHDGVAAQDCRCAEAGSRDVPNRTARKAGEPTYSLRV
jgi:putative ABC transport system permease protein